VFFSNDITLEAKKTELIEVKSYSEIQGYFVKKNTLTVEINGKKDLIP